MDAVVAVVTDDWLGHLTLALGQQEHKTMERGGGKNTTLKF